MLPVLRLAVAGCSIAGVLLLAPSGQAHAAETLSPRIQTQILNVLATRNGDGDRCIPTTPMSQLVGSYPHLARQIVAFASANLASRGDLLDDDCACPADLAVSAIRVVPDLAGPLGRALEDRYPECGSAVETAMVRSLSEIAPGAGGGARPSDPTPLRSRPTEESGFTQQASADGAGPSQLSGLTGGPSAKLADAAASDLSPELQAEILEALETPPQRENQCIAMNAFSALVAAHPDLALAIMEFADLKLPEKGRLLGDECVCPIELATATVLAVPELEIPVRRALDDRYPECTEPAAAGRNRKLPLEPPCDATASPSC